MSVINVVVGPRGSLKKNLELHILSTQLHKSKFCELWDLAVLRGKGGISPFCLRKRRVAKTGFLIFLVSHTMVLLINRVYRKRAKHVTSKNNFGIFYSR